MTERLFVQVLGSAFLTPGPPGADIAPDCHLHLPPSNHLFPAVLQEQAPWTEDISIKLHKEATLDSRDAGRKNSKVQEGPIPDLSDYRANKYIWLSSKSRGERQRVVCFQMKCWHFGGRPSVFIAPPWPP